MDMVDAQRQGERLAADSTLELNHVRIAAVLGEVADFIKGLDALVRTSNANALVNGRLITINGFALTEDPEVHFPALEATFSITTYLTPPEQSLSAGAVPTAPEASTATAASTTTGGAP